MSLLMVTTDKQNQEAVEQTLRQSYGLGEVVWVENGADALAALQADTFDLIYFDLPGRSGYETFSQIIDRAPLIPLIFVAAMGDESLALNALEQGACHYLIKDPDGGYLTLLPFVIRQIHHQEKENSLYQQNLAVLEASEEKHKTFLDAIDDAILVLDVDLRLLLFNQAFLRWNEKLGLETDVIGKNLFDVFPFLSNKIRDECRWVFESGQELVNKEYVKMGSKELYLEIHKIPIIENNTVSQVMTIVRDITHQSHQVEALGEFNRPFDDAQKIAYMGNWEIDFITGETIWSRQLEQILGVTPAEFDSDINKVIKTILHPDDVDRVINIILQKIGDAIRSDPDIEDGSIQLPTFEYRMIPPDGIERIVLSEGDIIFQAGHPTKMVGTVQDITDQKRTEIEIRQQSAQLEALRQLGLEITAQLDLKTLLQSVVRQAMNLIGGTSGGLYLYLPEQDVLQLGMYVGPESLLPDTTLSKGEGLAGKVWETGQPLIVDDYQHWEGRADAYVDLSWTAVVGVPICWGAGKEDADFLGVLDVLTNPPHTFSTADVDLLNMFATHAAIAIRNVRLYEETRRRNLEQETLSRISRALNTLEVQDTFPILVKELQNLIVCDRVSLSFIDVKAKEFRMVVLSPATSVLKEGTTMPLSATSATNNLLAGRPHLTKDLSEETSFVGEKLLYQSGVRSRVNLPLVVGSEVIGSLNLASHQVGYFREDQLPVLQQIADVLASAVRNSQLYEIERQRRQEADTLRESALVLTTALHEQLVVEHILAQLQQVVPFDTCSVQVYRGNSRHGTEGELEIVGGRGFTNWPEIKGLILTVGGDNPNTAVVRTRTSLVVGEAPSEYGDFQLEPHAQAGIQSWLGVPMLIGNRLIGMIALDKKAPNFYTQKHARLTEAFAAQAAVAMENARLYEEAQQHAEMMSVLLNEVNHRVKNNLTGIIGLLYVARSRARVNDQASYQQTMDELIGRVRGLASAHTMLSESEWTPLFLNDLAAEIIHAALRALPYDKQVSVDILKSSVRVTADQAHNLALVINELATNTVKYAFQDRNAGTITFQSKLEDHLICCEFKDDGPGYPQEVLQLAYHSVGFELIKNIVQSSMRGEFSLHNDEGAVTKIKFKAEV